MYEYSYTVDVQFRKQRFSDYKQVSERVSACFFLCALMDRREAEDWGRCGGVSVLCLRCCCAVLDTCAVASVGITSCTLPGASLAACLCCLRNAHLHQEENPKKHHSHYPFGEAIPVCSPVLRLSFLLQCRHSNSDCIRLMIRSCQRLHLTHFLHKPFHLCFVGMSTRPDRLLCFLRVYADNLHPVLGTCHRHCTDNLPYANRTGYVLIEKHVLNRNNRYKRVLHQQPLYFLCYIQQLVCIRNIRALFDTPSVKHTELTALTP